MQEAVWLSCGQKCIDTERLTLVNRFVVQGKVSGIMEFGCFVEINGFRRRVEGLVHINNLANRRSGCGVNCHLPTLLVFMLSMIDLKPSSCGLEWDIRVSG